jgi:hypothetical protein
LFIADTCAIISEPHSIPNGSDLSRSTGTEQEVEADFETSQ